MKHGKATVFALALSIALLAVGCAQKCCLQDYDEIFKRAGLPPDLECNPEKACQNTRPPDGPPSDVDNPEREPRFITLHECLAMALENGTTGLQSVRLFGTLDDDLVTSRQLGGNFFFGDSIKVLAYDPSILGTNIEASLARYDVVARSLLGFTAVDQPTTGPNAFQNGQFTAFGASLEKANPYGGLSNITFGTPTTQNFATPGGVRTGDFYNNFSQRNLVSGQNNPTYTPDLRFTYSQPLLRNWGPDINSLLAQHPEIGQGGAQGLSTNPGSQVGIVITRIAFDQARTDFERAVTFMLTNIEFAYWNLYGSFVNLYATEQGMRMAHMTWKVGKAQFEGGKTAIQDVSQALGQFEQFRGDRLAALGKVLEAERTLRGLIGLPMEDGKRLVPVDKPTVSPYLPDWNSALQECKALRPELIMQRLDLKQKQMELIREKNTLLPDLSFQAQYALHGAGTRLDGDSVFANGLTDNALRSLASDHFNDYSFGLTLAVPLGYRAQYAAVRAAKLRLAQSYFQLSDQEYRAERFLTFAYRDVIEKFNAIEMRRSQREAYTTQLEARFRLVLAGKNTPDSFLLQAQRDWATALQQEYQAVVDYNNALARFHFAKGTALRYNSITIAEGQLPVCALAPAVEHERKRADAIVCRERANVVCNPPCDNGAPSVPVPELPKAGAPSLPALIQSSPPTPVKLDDVLPPLALKPPKTAAPSNVSAAPATAPAPPFASPPHAVPVTMPTTPGPLPAPTMQPAVPVTGVSWSGG
jgi:outer membrane protein TolC